MYTATPFHTLVLHEETDEEVHITLINERVYYGGLFENSFWTNHAGQMNINLLPMIKQSKKEKKIVIYAKFCSTILGNKNVKLIIKNNINLIKAE